MQIKKIVLKTLKQSNGSYKCQHCIFMYTENKASGHFGSGPTQLKSMAKPHLIVM